ncbi:MAG: adenylosuccinate lyase [Chloroflexi bacterium]|nr:adenylosuccinate lyase [Chloroflexota bacterium]
METWLERYSYPEMRRIWSIEYRTDQWLKVEIAACEAWAELGVIPKSALEPIRRAHYDLAEMAALEKETQHDVVAFVRSVANSIGEEGRFIHLGLTSYDVVDTALGLQLRGASDLLIQDHHRLLDVLRRLAIRYKDTPMIGRTHGVHAEPITFGLKLALWHEETRRNLTRLEQAREQVCIGKLSGAVGTYATVPPTVEESVCHKLGLQPAPISSQIIQRDRHAQFVATLAIIASSLDKMATEVRALQRTEVREVEEPFGEGQQGSSAMPHKRNPVLSERICGLARVIRGYALTAMENVALWHERDISHSSAERIILPTSCMLLDYMLNLFADLLEGMSVYPERMRANLEATGGLIFSQRVLLALIEQGMGRQEAYRVVQGHALRIWKEGGDFREAIASEPAVRALLPPGEIESLFDVGYFLRHVDTIFHRLGLAEGLVE